MKLHLGCANRYFKGWTNLDIRPGIGDISDDASKLTSIKNNSCDIIYASHLLEHFGRKEVTLVLSVWFKKLKPGGILQLSVPDFEKVLYMYQKGTGLDILMGHIMGGQRDEHDFHKFMFDKKILTELLVKTRFRTVREWDWRITDHNQYDDYSQAYIPHMDKKNGVMMSLNLEAIK